MLPAKTEVGQASLATEPDDVCEYSPVPNELLKISTPIVVPDMTMIKTFTDFMQLQLVIDSLPVELTPARRGRLSNLFKNTAIFFPVANLIWVERR